MQGFTWRPWNAASRTTPQRGLWQQIVNRNTSSQLLMTPCARQVMNRIPGSLTPPWPVWWGPPPLMPNEQSNIPTNTEKPTNSKADPQTETPPQHPRKANPRGRKDDPLPAVRIKSGGSSGSSPPEPAYSPQRDYLTVVARGYKIARSESNTFK